MDGSQQHPRELLTFLVELGAAMDTTTQPVYVVQSRLTNVARALWGEHGRRQRFSNRPDGLDRSW